MYSFIPIFIAGLSLAAAIPSQREAVQDHDISAMVADIEAIGETVASLVKTRRVNPETFCNEIPGCDEDPTLLIPKVSGYNVEQGVKLPKATKDDACNNKGSAGSIQCWTEYWFVESAVEVSGWQNSGIAIDCASTSQCNTDDSIAQQTCTAHTRSSTNGVDWELFNSKLEFATPDQSSGKVSFGSSLSYVPSQTDEDTNQFCTTSSSTGRCFWDDQQCHQVWIADRVKRIFGYQARVCTQEASTDGRQQMTRNSAGHWVHGQADFSITLPINKIVGCNAMCGDQTYDDPLPGGSDRVPFTESFERLQYHTIRLKKVIRNKG